MWPERAAYGADETHDAKDKKWTRFRSRTRISVPPLVLLGENWVVLQPQRHGGTAPVRTPSSTASPESRSIRLLGPAYPVGSTSELHRQDDRRRPRRAERRAFKDSASSEPKSLQQRFHRIVRPLAARAKLVEATAQAGVRKSHLSSFGMRTVPQGKQNGKTEFLAPQIQGYSTQPQRIHREQSVLPPRQTLTTRRKKLERNE